MGTKKKSPEVALHNDATFTWRNKLFLIFIEETFINQYLLYFLLLQDLGGFLTQERYFVGITRVHRRMIAMAISYEYTALW